MSTSYIFLDESGDLGFDFSKSKTSKYFVIACMFIQDKSAAEKIIKKTFSGFTKTQVKSHHGTLHAFKETPRTRLMVLNGIAAQNISAICIYLNKSQVYTQLQDEKHVLYNYVTNILLDRTFTKKLLPLNNSITLVAAKRETNKFLNDSFTEYLQQQSKSKHGVTMKVEIKTTTEAKCLQLADMVSWSFFRKYEHGDPSYIEVIKHKVIEEDNIFG